MPPTMAGASDLYSDDLASVAEEEEVEEVEGLSGGGTRPEHDTEVRRLGGGQGWGAGWLRVKVAHEIPTQPP